MDIYAPIQNKYYKWYMNICLTKSHHKKKGLIRHHIVPDSFYIERKRQGPNDGWLLGNPNEATNIIFVTTKEHCTLHHLLTKCYNSLPKAKMVFAYVRMCNKDKSSVHYKISINLWKNRDQNGENNAFFGKKHTEKTKAKIAKANRGRIFSEETRKIWSQQRKGNKSHTGQVVSQKTRDKIGTANKLRHLQKISLC